MHVILYVTALQPLLSEGLDPPPFSAVFILCYAPFGLVKCLYDTSMERIIFLVSLESGKHKTINIISRQKMYLDKNPFTCYLKKAKLARCCTLIMQLNDM